MRTNFTPDQLNDPNIAEAERQLRACVHCGICTATCPTYVLLGDELDSPRGRIQLIQNMLEKDATPSAKITTHIDRCLSCYACVSACPSGVNYPRLIDAAHAHIEQKATRPPAKRLLCWALGQILPSRNLLRPILALARMATPLAPLLPKFLRAPFDVATALPLPRQPATPLPLHTRGKTRIALHVGCVQDVVAPRINEAAHRVLTRHGFDVTVVQACCGSLNHHLGQTKAAHRHATGLVDEIASNEHHEPFAAIVTTVSGCGSTMRDYGFHLQGNDAAASIAARTRDIADLLRDVPLQPHDAHKGVRIAYHAACSLTHGMRQAAAAPHVLRKLGFDVVEPRDTNCCGSAGVYNVLEPEIAGELQQRKATALMAAKPTMIATGNIGCLAQIGAAVRVPVVHTIELIDWATGGPRP